MLQDSLLGQKDPFLLDANMSVADMVKNKMHLGHRYPQNFNTNFSGFVYEVKDDFVIIDLPSTYLYLKRAASYAALVARYGGVILFYAYSKKHEFICRKAAVNCSQFYYTGQWKSGMFLEPEKHLKCETLLVDGSLVKNPRIPDVIIIVGCGSYSFPNVRKDFLSTLSKNEIQEGILSPPAANLIKEANINFIPTIGLIDSDSDPYLVTYPVPGNDDNVCSVEYFLNTISLAIKHGVTILPAEDYERENITVPKSHSKH
ncbi:30S ribosomal protein S2, chloroplastic [Thelohanellus kitauei]|uniref:30S ribosomal protein S2, chloroplastic n=1 Tax=Thelohanellus kitauei TaxID=669202 RepID=A0A0C2IWU3_THEKT|nr:30S ribosomal protein S2, chloroplastic [Thelohanellus kitauei]